jgi:hypothetical protein
LRSHRRVTHHGCKPKPRQYQNALFDSLPHESSEARVHVSVIANDQQIVRITNNGE